MTKSSGTGISLTCRRGARLGLLLALCLVSIASAERREGQLVVYQIDALDGRSSSLGYQLREAGREELTELSFGVAPTLRSGDHIVVDGTVGADGRLHVDHAETVTDTSARAAAAAPTSGAQHTAVLLLDFHDATNANCSLAGAEDVLFGAVNSVSALYAESSFGQISFSGTAFGPFLIDDFRSQHCNPFGWAADADQLAAAAGVDLRPFARRVYLIATNPSWRCGWGGLSDLGIVPSRSVVEAYGACGYPSALAHELGHAIGMQHASTDPQDDGAIDDEYGDTSDVMGGSYSFFGHHNAAHKLEVGWIGASDEPLVTGNARLGIRPLEMPPPAGRGSAALRVARMGATGAYFVSLRRASGFDESLTPEFVDHVSIHTYGDFIGRRTALVRTLAPQETFRAQNFAVSYLATSAGGAFVEVAFSCESFPPVLELPAPSVLRPGGQAHLALQLRNDDTVLCDASAFPVVASGPAGWTTSLTPSLATVTPKQSATLDLLVKVPSDTPDGTYAIDVQVTDALGTAHAWKASLPVAVEACRAACETCGNGFRDPGEECDDGNAVDGDGCDTNCTTTRCGNGVVSRGESCDDGNTVSGDGCAATCEIECTTEATCKDGDRCNTAVCETGVCRHVEPHDYPGAICVIEALVGGGVCAPRQAPRKFAAKIARTIPRIVEALTKTPTATTKRAARLARRADRMLAALQTRAAKLVTRGKLAEPCGGLINEKITRTRTIIAAAGGL